MKEQDMPTITDWLMVAITLIYVVATIFICIANIQSAKASREQMEESKRQFYTINRPIVSVELVGLKRSFWVLKFTNHGNQTAFNTRIILDEQFIDSVEEKAKPVLRKNSNKVRTIGVNQSYNLYFATNEYSEYRNKPNIKGKIIYNGWDSSIYAEDFEVEVENYATFFSTKSEIGDLNKKIEEQTRELEGIKNMLERIVTTIMETDKDQQTPRD
jgi:cell division protein FtsL